MLVACGGGGDDADGRPSSPAASPAASGESGAAQRRAAGCGCARSRDFDDARLRHLAARRPGAAVRRRAGRARDGRARRAQAAHAVPRHPRPGHGGRRAGAAVDRLPARLRRQRAVLRLLHRQRPEPADRGVQARERGPRGPRLGAARAADARPRVQPQRRPAAVRAGRPDVRGDRRRRRGRRQARRARERAEPRVAARARSSGSTRAPAAGGPYQVPGSNPFVGRSGARGEVYSYGLRNPWRFSFDRRTGDLSIGDVGQNAYEEIDFVRRGAGRGANFGWRPFEGRSRYTDGESAPGAIGPVIVRSHSDGNCSITGGVVVRDRSLSLRGRYLFGDFCRGRIESARLTPGRARDVRNTSLKVSSLSSFGEDAQGRVYVVSLEGPVYRIAPR